jgi:hypothetical protein
MANRVAGGLNPPAPTPSAFAKAMTGQDVLWNGVAALSVQNHRKVKGTEYQIIVLRNIVLQAV